MASGCDRFHDGERVEQRDAARRTWRRDRGGRRGRDRARAAPRPASPARGRRARRSGTDPTATAAGSARRRPGARASASIARSSTRSPGAPTTTSTARRVDDRDGQVRDEDAAVRQRVAGSGSGPRARARSRARSPRRDDHAVHGGEAERRRDRRRSRGGRPARGRTASGRRLRATTASAAVEQVQPLRAVAAGPSPVAVREGHREERRARPVVAGAPAEVRGERGADRGIGPGAVGARR